MRVPPLRGVLIADAAVCLVSGAAFALAPEALASALTSGGAAVLGLAAADALRLLGVAVSAVGAAVWLVARLEPIPPAAVLPILGVEVAWFAASAALLAAAGGREALTPLGVAAVGAGAAAVLAFLVLEALGLRARPGAAREASA
jgi:hypothetical protein